MCRVLLELFATGSRCRAPPCVTLTAVAPTLRLRLERLVRSEDEDEQQGLSTLEDDVDEGEQIQGSDDLGGKGHLQDGGAQLDVLTACRNGYGSSPSGCGGGGWSSHIS